MAASGRIGNVTWKQIDIESCVIPLFLQISAWRVHFWHRFCILTSPTIEIQDGRLRPYWKCNLKVNGHRNLCNITFPTKCGIENPFLASFLYFDESKYQNSRWPPFTNSIFFCFGSYNPYYWISHEKLVFSNMCLFPGIISCIWRAQTSKFKMATSSHIDNLTPTKVVMETGIISHFLLIFAHRAHFWHHLCILTGLNGKPQDGRHLSFPLFSDLSYSIHCYCWMSHKKLVSSIICWFYVLLLHIFQQWSPRKVEINNLFK